MREPHNPRQNHLLAALPEGDRERLYPHLELVAMSLGDVLYESGNHLQHVYFPTDSIVSLLYVMLDGASAEIAVVGNDGIIGIALFMGGETHAQSGRGAERRLRLPAAGVIAQAGIHSLRSAAAFVAAVHPGPADANGANGGVQSASYGRPATMPLAAVEPGPVAL